MKMCKKAAWALGAAMLLGITIAQQAAAAKVIGTALPWDWAKKKIEFYNGCTKEFIEKYQSYYKLVEQAKNLGDLYQQGSIPDKSIIETFNNMQGSTTGILGYLGFNPDSQKKAWDSIKDIKVIGDAPHAISFETLRLGSAKATIGKDIDLKSCMLSAIKQVDRDYEKNLMEALPLVLDKQESAETRVATFKKNASYLQSFVDAQDAIDAIETCNTTTGYDPSCLLPALKNLAAKTLPAFNNMHAWYKQFDENRQKRIVADLEATQKEYQTALKAANNLNNYYKVFFIMLLKLAVPKDVENDRKDLADKVIQISKHEFGILVATAFVIEELKAIAGKIKTFKLTEKRAAIDKLISDISCAADIVALLASDKQTYTNQLKHLKTIGKTFTVANAKFSTEIVYDAAIKKLDGKYDKSDTESALNQCLVPLYTNPPIDFKYVSLSIQRFVATYEEARVKATGGGAKEETAQLETNAKELLEALIKKIKSNIASFLIATQIITQEQLADMQKEINTNASTLPLGRAYKDAVISALATNPSTETRDQARGKIFNEKILPALQTYINGLANIQTSPMFRATEAATMAIATFDIVFERYLADPIGVSKKTVLEELDNVKTAVLLVAKIMAKTSGEYGETTKDLLKKNITTILENLKKAKKLNLGVVIDARLTLLLAIASVKQQILQNNLPEEEIQSPDWLNAIEDTFFKPIREAIAKKLPTFSPPKQVPTYKPIKPTGKPIKPILAKISAEDIAKMDEEIKKIEEKAKGITFTTTEEETGLPFELVGIEPEIEITVPTKRDREITVPITTPITKLAEALKGLATK